ncbi:MAG: hypothetical protein KDB22_29505, partial [Planctomycetales bacterium]|nr:hypothetical protein [Planctomycetales bacterium]
PTNRCTSGYRGIPTSTEVNFGLNTCTRCADVGFNAQHFGVQTDSHRRLAPQERPDQRSRNG